MKEYLKLMRVNHYIKNLLIFLPIIFNKSFLNLNKLIPTIIGFVSFCLISSSIYIINDINDLEKDRKHPIKRNRPIASGKIKVKTAKVISIILLIISIIFLVLGSFKYSYDIIFSVSYLIMYFGLNIIYSLGLKKVPIIDIAILASGFLIRVLLGGIVSDVIVSSWLYLTIISVSFYLGLAKRRNELKKHKGLKTRDVLKFYNKDFLNNNMYIFGATSIVFYSLWAKSYEKDLILWTIPIVMIIMMKYNLDIESNDSEGDPVNVILHDYVMLFLGFIYSILIVLALY